MPALWAEGCLPDVRFISPVVSSLPKDNRCPRRPYKRERIEVNSEKKLRAKTAPIKSTSLLRDFLVTYSTPLQPRQVRLELTSYCNAHCASCHRLSMKRAPEHMPWDLLQKCLEDIRYFPETLTELVPNNYGETFLHPRWYEALELICQKLPRTRLVLPTNGTLLDEVGVELLCRLPNLQLVNFSVNAISPKLYEAFHKLPATMLADIERVVLRFKQLRPDILIWISMVQDSQYQSPREIELFREFWSRYGVVQINPAHFNDRPTMEPLLPVEWPCRSLFSDLVVACDGRVSSCCFDADLELVVGDARKENLLSIWHGKALNELRNKHLAGERGSIPLCRRCTFA